MAITISCPGCNTRFRVADGAAGMQGKCKICQASIRIPSVQRAAYAGASARRLVAVDETDDGPIPFTVEPPVGHQGRRACSVCGGRFLEHDLKVLSGVAFCAGCRTGICPPPRITTSGRFTLRHSHAHQQAEDEPSGVPTGFRSVAAVEARLLLYLGLAVLGVGGVYSELFDNVVISSRSVAVAVIVYALAVLFGAGLIVAGYIRAAMTSSGPWNGARRGALIIAALWTTVIGWMVNASGIRDGNDMWNEVTLLAIPPTLILWLIAVTPAPAPASGRDR